MLMVFGRMLYIYGKWLCLSMEKNYFFENCLIWLNLFFGEFFGLIKI